MNTRSFHPGLIRRLSIVAAGLSLACAMVTSGAEKTNQPSGASHNATNSPAKPAAIEIPTSQFVIPTAAGDGRNPFFPESVINRIPTGNTNSTNKPAPAATLVLQGISGTGAKRFALINGRTFAAGEDADVPAGRGKVHVLCISIRDDGVTIEVEGNRQELKMRPGL